MENDVRGYRNGRILKYILYVLMAVLVYVFGNSGLRTIQEHAWRIEREVRQTIEMLEREEKEISKGVNKYRENLNNSLENDLSYCAAIDLDDVIEEKVDIKEHIRRLSPGISEEYLVLLEGAIFSWNAGEFSQEECEAILTAMDNKWISDEGRHNLENLNWDE